MKSINEVTKIFRHFDEVIQYFINHDANSSLEFSDKIDELIDIKADLANEFQSENEDKTDIC